VLLQVKIRDRGLALCQFDSCDWIMLSVLIVVSLSSAMSHTVDERVKAILGDVGSDISHLPVLDRVTRDSATCPGVKEDLVRYRLDLQEIDDLPAASVILSQVVVHDLLVQTESFTMIGKPWIRGNVTIRSSLNCLDQEDLKLIDTIREHYLVPSDGQDYNFSQPMDKLEKEKLQGEVGQPLEVDQLVYNEDLKNGFFIEAGSFDSETNSDSLYFEVTHGWTGLLVEPHPLAFAEGLEKHRKANSIQTCLSTSTKPETMDFDPFGAVRNETFRESMSGLVTNSGPSTFKIQCLPLYSIIMALGNPTVHYLSLDVEGAEFPILKTIPWDKVDIRVLSVETHLAGRLFPGDRSELISYMESVGYQHIPWGHTGTSTLRTNLGTTDDMFVKNGIPVKRRDEL